MVVQAIIVCILVLFAVLLAICFDGCPFRGATQKLTGRRTETQLHTHTHTYPHPHPHRRHAPTQESINAGWLRVIEERHVVAKAGWLHCSKLTLNGGDWGG